MAGLEVDVAGFGGSRRGFRGTSFKAGGGRIESGVREKALKTRSFPIISAHCADSRAVKLRQQWRSKLHFRGAAFRIGWSIL